MDSRIADFAWDVLLAWMSAAAISVTFWALLIAAVFFIF